MQQKILLLDASLGESPVKDNFPREINTETMCYKISEKKYPNTFDFDGLIISGSSTSVNENKEWINKSMEYVKKEHKTNKPILGICWGHQLIAKALNGEVTKLENRKIGYKKIKLTEEGKKDKKLFKDVPHNFLAFITHHDHIKKLPKNSKVLAKRKDTIQGFKINKTYGVQFHPEYDLKTAKEVTKKYLNGKRLEKTMETLNQENLEKAKKEGGKVLKNFEEIVKKTK